MPEWVEIAVLAAAWVLSLVWGLLIVARRAGKLGVRFWTAWLMSKEADPYMDRVAERVMVKMEPRLSGFEDRINQPVQLDLLPIVAMVEDRLAPRFASEVDRVRTFIDGKIGWVKKVGKETGEFVAERAGEAALAEAGIDPAESELLGELEATLADKEWVAEHRAGAFGLRLLKREWAKSKGGITLTGRSGYNPGRRRRK